MKKRVIAVIIVAFALLVMVACSNRQIFDSTFKFERAIVCQADGKIVSGNVESWRDFEDGDMIQVKIDGKTYLVHSSQATLIAE